MDKQTESIRRLLQHCDRRRPNKALPKAIRDAVVKYAAARRPEVTWSTMGEDLGLAASTIQRWCALAEVPVTDSVALVPIGVRAAAPVSEVVLVSPRGFRLEGLRLDEAALLMDRLA